MNEKATKLPAEPSEPGMEVFAEGSYDDRERFWLLIRSGLARIPYLQLVSRKLDGPVGSMLEVTYRIKRLQLDPEAILADVVRIWESEVVDHSSVSYKVFRPDENIAVRFALIDPTGFFVSGTVTILLQPGS